MYVLALYGSPRQQGNTDILLDEFIKGVLSANQIVQIKKVFIRDLKISPCLEYNDCLSTGECIIKDEMTVLYDKLLKADLIVLSAPIFFYNVPAQVKIIIDRCQALWARKYILKNMPKSNNRKGFFISVGGTKGENLFTGASLTVKYFFKAINVDYAGNIFYKSIDTKGVIIKHPTALKEVFEAGQNLVTEFQK
ncbi:MAG: flavodoxin family protein [Planctomycetota bacterium]